jgi:hypothetical protein
MFEETYDPLSWIPSYKGKSVPSVVTAVQDSFLHCFCFQYLYVCLICNGLQDDSILVDLAATLASEGVNVFRFDFAGNE